MWVWWSLLWCCSHWYAGVPATATTHVFYTTVTFHTVIIFKKKKEKNFSDTMSEKIKEIITKCLCASVITDFKKVTPKSPGDEKCIREGIWGDALAKITLFFSIYMYENVRWPWAAMLDWSSLTVSEAAGAHHGNCTRVLTWFLCLFPCRRLLCLQGFSRCNRCTVW